MRLRLLATAAALCLSTLAAHADTITVYDVSGLFVASSPKSQTGSFTLSGTLTLDETTGVFIAANLGGYTHILGQLNGSYAGTSELDLNQYTGYGYPYLDLYFPTNSFVNYQGGSLGSIDMPTNGQMSSISYLAMGYTLQSGSLTPTVTPEPSSIALLGTGLVGMFGVMRKRFA